MRGCCVVYLDLAGVFLFSINWARTYTEARLQEMYVRCMSDAHQTLARCMSDAHQMLARCMSDAHQMHARCMPDACQMRDPFREAIQLASNQLHLLQMDTPAEDPNPNPNPNLA